MAEDKEKKRKQFEDLNRPFQIAKYRSKFDTMQDFTNYINQRVKVSYHRTTIQNIISGKRNNEKVRGIIEDFIWEYAPEDMMNEFKGMSIKNLRLLTKSKLYKHLHK